jgi:hypothetical protein
VVAIVLSALVLFEVGVYSPVTLVGDWRKSGSRMLVIDLGAAGSALRLNVSKHPRQPDGVRWRGAPGWPSR